MPTTPRTIRLRYPAVCADCGASLSPGTRASWDGDAREARCLDHTPDEPTPQPAPGAVAAASPSDQLSSDGQAEGRPAADRELELEGGPEMDLGTAGDSAQREYDRRRTAREARIRGKHRRIGGLILALTHEPQSTRAWEVGAEGERELGKRLDEAAERGVVVLHDRRIPRSTANIDHIAVGPGGVFVIDAKKYTGKVEKRDVGGFLRKDERLYVGRRDRSKLVEGVLKQVEVVRTTLASFDSESTIPVTGVLCFVKAEWSLFSRPMQLDGVTIIWPRALPDALTREPLLLPDQIQETARNLAERLLPA